MDDNNNSQTVDNSNLEDQPTKDSSGPSSFGLGSNPVGTPINNNPNPTFSPMADQGSTSKNDDNEEKNNEESEDNSGTSKPSSDLEAIKKEALNSLAPLVDKLNQTPEEKYRTLMLLIQSSDDKSLIKSAYEAASKIEDEEKKAEALLGVVNEIEYFSRTD